MAKTYHAEGRQVAYFLRSLCIVIGASLYFNIPGLHWGYFFGILIGSVILGEIAGAMLTAKRRLAVLKTNKKAAVKKAAIAASSSKSKKLTDQELIQADVDSLSGSEFERLMELYYMAKGYTVLRVGGAGDHEVDLILKGKEGYKIAVQCKRWKRDVGNDIVLRLKAGKQVHGCYDAWIVTTSNFTKAAKEAAERLNIKLINGLSLHDKLTSWRKAMSANDFKGQVRSR
ncbi:restriction endonuclease [Cohnella hashimotonis]|uniref:Restriction endonuclease n=1 Tax=Cohnella hashimotonis TaxID=2826895 RepID=A0ABT6TQG6_9BACL|nr:restriction endonuclease [Cohnella hashimotonis]MDI4648781.1 restriction endonuclease [Cohnella hashimotonis]